MPKSVSPGCTTWTIGEGLGIGVGEGIKDAVGLSPSVGVGEGAGVSRVTGVAQAESKTTRAINSFLIPSLLHISLCRYLNNA